MQQNLQRKWNYNHSCDKLAVIYVAACAKQDRLMTGISVGLTPAVIGESLDDALKRADKALDRSKEKGQELLYRGINKTGDVDNIPGLVLCLQR